MSRVYRKSYQDFQTDNYNYFVTAINMFFSIFMHIGVTCTKTCVRSYYVCCSLYVLLTLCLVGKFVICIITLIHTSFSPKTTLQFFLSIGSHNNKKCKKIFFGRLVFVGGKKMCFFT